MTERSQFGRCRSCFGTIVFALNENDKPAPFDMSETGNFILVRVDGKLRASRGCPRCRHATDDHERERGCVVTLNNSTACGCTGQRALPHFATCPDAHAWRAGEKRRTP